MNTEDTRCYDEDIDGKLDSNTIIYRVDWFTEMFYIKASDMTVVDEILTSEFYSDREKRSLKTTKLTFDEYLVDSIN
tara:strand:- start:2135 stop:2365 length:231 start_codon:yes stop_codon:yes gene_type:complete